MVVTVEAGSLIQNNAACPCPASLTLAGFTPTGNCKFAIIAVSIQPGCNSVTSITRTGDCPVLIRRQACPACTAVELWKIENPVAGAVDVVINLSCSPAGVAAAVINFNGVCPTTPHDTELVNGFFCVTSDTLTPTTSADDYLTDVINAICPACPAVINVGANQTRRLDHNDDCGVAHGSSDQDGADGGAMSWSWDCVATGNHIAVNINATPPVGGIEIYPHIVNIGAMI